MASPARSFRSAVWIDAWLGSLLLFELVLRLFGARQLGELAPFVLHVGHAAIAVVGALGCAAPQTSWPARTLVVGAPLAAFADALACVWHTNVFAAEYGRHSAGERSECTVLAALSLVLAASSLHVSVAARRQATTLQ